MPRPIKCRRVCSMPKVQEFKPVIDKMMEPIIMSIDEYETIRLIDKIGLSQEECGTYMQIARTTVQQIYTIARKKIADAIVDGRPLKIEGGNFALCNDTNEHCVHNHNKLECCGFKDLEKGVNKMIIAIPTDENKLDVCISFGRAPFFTFYNLESNELIVKENPAENAEGGAGIKAAQFIVDEGASILLTVRCGQNSKEVFDEVDLKVYKTNGPTVKENIEAYKNNQLNELKVFHAGFHGAQ